MQDHFRYVLFFRILDQVDIMRVLAQWGQAGCLCDRVWVNERHPPVGNTQRGHANLLTLNNLRKNFNQKRLQSDFNLLWAMGQKADPG